MKTTLRDAAVAKLSLFLACTSIAHAQLSTAWITQFGTGGDDVAKAIAVDSTGQSWVTGFTGGSLGGPSAGGNDFFLSRVSSTGTVTSTAQRGSTEHDWSYGIALLGNTAIFTGGNTVGSPDGQTNLGGYDNAILRYNTSGIWQSTRLSGTSTYEYTNGLAANSTNFFSTGYSGDAGFVTKSDSTGSPIWTSLVSSDPGGSVTGDSVTLDTTGNSYMAGSASSALPGAVNAGGYDICVIKFDSNGNPTLIKQRGTSSFDRAQGVKVDLSGNIYLAGYTQGNLDGQTNAGLTDGFLTKLDSAGNLLWTRLIGGSGADAIWALDMDSSGNLWIGGYSDSNLGVHINAGGHDAFVAEYDVNGNLLGTDFLATAADEILFGLAAAPGGGVVVTGYTNGNLGGTNAGAGDIFVAQIVPEPTTSVSLLLGLGALASLRNRRALRRTVS